MKAKRRAFEAIHLPIETPRLHLVTPTARFVREYRTLLNDEGVSKWLLRVPFPYRARDGAEFVQRARRSWRSGEALALTIVHGTTGHVIGGIGLHGISWEHRHAEVGYWIGRPHWGLGYASEAVGALLTESFETLHLHRVEAGVFRGNSGSVNVLRKAGFRPEGVRREAFWRRGEWLDDLAFGLTESEWRRRRALSTGEEPPRGWAGSQS